MATDVRELERRIRRWKAVALVSWSFLGLVLLGFLVCGGFLVVRSQREAMMQRERAEAAMQESRRQRDQAEKARREAEEAARP